MARLEDVTSSYLKETSMPVVGAYLSSVPTSGHNLTLEAVGAGILLGLAAHLFTAASTRTSCLHSSSTDRRQAPAVYEAQRQE